MSGTLAGSIPRTGSEGPCVENSSDAVTPDQPGTVGDDGASTCDNCSFSTRNGWELKLVPADDLDLDVRGYHALLCKDCREEHRVDGGRR